MASALILSSAFLHALWNGIVKWEGDPKTTARGVFLAAALFSFPFLFFAGRPYFPHVEGLGWAVASGLCEAGYVASLALALEEGGLGPSYAIMRGGAMILVWVLSILFLGEKAGWASFLGATIILAGLVLLHDPRHILKSLTTRKWAYISAAFIAGYHIFYGRSLARGAGPIPLFALSCAIAVPVLLVSGGKNEFKKIVGKIKSRAAVIAVGGGLSTVSFVLFLTGLQNEGAGRAISLRNTSVAWAQIFAVLIGEKVTKRQWMAVLLIVLGAAILVPSVSEPR